MSASAIQTDTPPVTPRRSVVVQTPPTPSRALKSALVQTDAYLSTSSDEYDADASAPSSSSLQPATPQRPSTIFPQDSPPAYEQELDIKALGRMLESVSRDYPDVQNPDGHAARIVERILKQWHKGAQEPFMPLPAGVSPQALENWAELKRELGAECSVLDRLIGAPGGGSTASTPASGGRRRMRFRNVYNTYFVSKGNDVGVAAYATPVLLGFVVSTVMFVALSPGAGPFAVPGMPTYEDRAYWTAFNALEAATGEVVRPGQAQALWRVLGDLLLGSANVARRVHLPT